MSLCVTVTTDIRFPFQIYRRPLGISSHCALNKMNHVVMLCRLGKTLKLTIIPRPWHRQRPNTRGTVVDEQLTHAQSMPTRKRQAFYPTVNSFKRYRDYGNVKAVKANLYFVG